MTPISVTISGDTPSSVTLTALVRNDNDQAVAVSPALPQNFTSEGAGVYTYNATDPNGDCPTGYTFTYFITWSSDGTTTAPITQSTMGAAYGAGLVTLAYAKDFIGLTVTTFDSFLQNRINAVSAAIQRYTQRTFGIGNYVELLDGPGSTSLRLKQRPVVAVSQIVTNIGSQFPQTIPGSGVVINAAAGIISVNIDGQYNQWFDYGDQNHQVSYTAGFAAIPLDIQDACAQAVSNLYFKRGRDMTLASESLGDYSYTNRQDAAQLLSPDIKTALNYYRDPVV